MDWLISVPVGIVLVALACVVMLIAVGLIFFVVQWVDGWFDGAGWGVVLMVAMIGVAVVYMTVVAHEKALPWIRGIV